MSRKDSSHSIEIVLYYQLTCIFFQQITTNLSIYGLYNDQLQNFFS